MKEEIFAKILNVVCSETEIPASTVIAKCTKAEAVDARHIIARLLYEQGFYKSQISERLHLTDRAVCFMLGGFEERLRYNRMMRINYERIKKRLCGDNEKGWNVE